MGQGTSRRVFLRVGGLGVGGRDPGEGPVTDLLDAEGGQVTTRQEWPQGVVRPTPAIEPVENRHSRPALPARAGECVLPVVMLLSLPLRRPMQDEILNQDNVASLHAFAGDKVRVRAPDRQGEPVARVVP